MRAAVTANSRLTADRRCAPRVRVNEISLFHSDSTRSQYSAVLREMTMTARQDKPVDADEIKRLGKRFKKLDLDNSGSLSVEEFMSLPELQQNPLVQRVIDIFDTDGNGEVDFKEFIEGVSQFSVKGDKEQKIYDMDKDGYISNGELFQVLKMMVGNNLKDTQLQQIVDKTIINADKDGDGRISFEEFCAVVGGLDIHKKMVVDHEILLLSALSGQSERDSSRAIQCGLEKEDKRVCVCDCECTHGCVCVSSERGLFCIYLAPVLCFVKMIQVYRKSVNVSDERLDFSVTCFKHEVPIESITIAAF
ncbi:hypothetical protein DNTS_004474 [Danionella cerebrum]|uniref:EF-hand domain-containing protein n=1 Tax=Danionella cerebrum TaxID=2873325 RepID=A0A553PZK3_9TELE|nr:hypothetical protein DNTS_004474 [Danionella translucida]